MADETLIHVDASESERATLIDQTDGNGRAYGGLGVRHILIAVGFIGFANVYAMRVNLSVAIVAMVNSSAIPHQNHSSDVCKMPDSKRSSAVSEMGEFAWNEAEQGLVLGSFFWGYMITNLIGGRLAELIGGKKVFLAGVFVTSVLTLFLPMAARTSFIAVVILRVLIGLGEGVTFPAMNHLMSRWIPPLERSQTASMIYGGCQFGTVISLPISGILCQSDILGGWPAVFYLFGAVGLVWCLLWLYLIYESPSSHPYISHKEKRIIESSLNRLNSQDEALPAPYRHIFSSRPFWAILVAHVCQNWGFYFLLTELPTYLNNVLHFDIKSNSILSAAPYLAMWVFSLAFTHTIDHLRRKGSVSTTVARKISNSIGFYGPMVCLILVGYSGCNWKLSIFLLTLAVGLNGAVLGGYTCSHLDIAPNYAGLLMGITNCAATVPGILAPAVVGYLINGEETLTQWRLAFWIAGVVLFIGNTFYISFFSGEEQHWNRMYEKGTNAD